MSSLARNLLIAGLCLFFFPPFIGLVVTVISMIAAFHTLGQNGIADPQLLSHEIGLTLIATVSGIVLSVLGLGFLVAAGIALYVEKRKGRAL